eukprot:SAG11_NODE_618_length_8174_cov_41.665718_5_plen_79_part_00
MDFTLVEPRHPLHDEHWGRVPKEALPTGCYLRGPRYSSSGFFYHVLPVLLDTSGNFEKLQDLLQWTRGRGCRSATLLS